MECHESGQPSPPWNDEGENLESILRSAATGLSKESKEAFDILTGLASEGMLERHQTEGSLVTIADRLLEALKGTGSEN